MNARHRMLTGAALALAMLLSLGCLDDGGRTTALSFSCEGCDATAMAAGEELTFEVGWTGTEWGGGMDSSRSPTCDPVRVGIVCLGAVCETTRNNTQGQYWSLAEAAAREPSGCCTCGIGTESFEVRPVSGGAWTVVLQLENVRSGELVAYRFGPIEVSPPTVQPEASCSGAEWDRVAMGVPVDVHVDWDGQDDAASDPIARQPFYLDLDCGNVACEARLNGSADYAPLERLFVPAQPASNGINAKIRATAPGTMDLTARLEHAETGEVVTFDLATLEYHAVQALEVHCLNGELCDGQPEQNPRVVFGVVGLDGSLPVLVLPQLRYTSNVEDAPQSTTCSPEPFVDGPTGPGWSCQGRLYEFGGATQYTIVAEWDGLSASLTAPAP